MTRFLKIGIVILAAFVVGFLLYSQFFKTNQVKIGDGSRLPDFSFMKLGEKGTLDRGDLDAGKTVVVYFSPNCSHCQKLASDLGSKVEYLTEINFVWITRFDEGEALQFAKSMNLWEKKNLYFGLDKDANFYRYFGDMFIPSTYIYDENGKLLQQLNQDAMVRDIMLVYDGGVSDKFRKTR
jgi:thiol-disulfide isomerase/thioredoxin